MAEIVLTFPRSRPPAISPSFLSRAHLFSLFESQTPGATLVVAPAGYGKTILVSEWAQASARPTIWYTADSGDSFEDFKAHLGSSIGDFIPNLKLTGVNSDNLINTNSINSLVKIVSDYPQDVNFVIDFGRGVQEGILPFRQLLIDAVPDNVHLVIVRRASTDASLSRYASLGNLSLITSEDLKFSDSEISAVTTINNVNLKEDRNASELALCNGWPAAVQLMCRNIGKNNSHSTFADAVASNVSPLSLLALESYESLSEQNQQRILKLSLVEEFDIEIASLLLGDDFSESYINKLVTDGLFVTASTTSKRSYRFNPLVFEAISQIPQLDKNVASNTHEKLMDLYLQRGDASRALSHSFASGNQLRFRELFRSSMREMADLGRGDLLLKWSHFAGDDSPHGEIMRKTIKVVGHMVNADFLRAEAMSAELEFTASHTPEGAFISDLCAMVRSHVYFARGDFTRTIESLGKATRSLENPNSLHNGDRIALLRLSAANAFLHDDFVELARCHEEAKKLSEIDSLKSTSYHLNCISAMVLYSHGEYHQASEMARISILQANLDGYKTIAAPLDAMMVLVRCQLEASELDQVIVTAHAIMELAQTWEIWPWYFMAQGTIIRLHITQGMLSQASEAITQQRLHVKRLSISNQLSWLVDMSELFLKLSLKDLDRINVLLSRMPAIEMVKQIELSLQFAKNPKKVLQIITAMPENTPRERIQKLLTEASAHSNHENLAFKSLIKALDLGAEYGYHEYFLRQRDLYPLIVKAATQKPTIYLENLAKDMTQRISSSNSTAGEIDKKLTNRELEILKHLNSGNPISAIAKSLHISQNTMKTHLRNTYRKLDADGRHSAVEKAKKLLLM